MFLQELDLQGDLEGGRRDIWGGVAAGIGAQCGRWQGHTDSRSNLGFLEIRFEKACGAR